MHRIEGANAILDSNGYRVFTEEPPPTTITDDWLNAVQEEICHVIEQAGITLKTQATDTHTQLYQAITTLGNPYDYVVYSNPTFLDAIERVGVNQYKFKDNIESIHFKSAEYSMTYILSGGDTWGYIETNQCEYVDFEMGAYINMGNERSYIEINTEGCLLNNVSIRGLGTVASAISRSFLLNENYVTYMNCNSQTRLTNANCSVFEGSGTASHNQTSKYINCLVRDFNASGGNLVIIKNAQNINNFYAIDIESSTAAGYIRIFDSCKNITNVQIITIDHTNVNDIECIWASEFVNNVQMSDIDGGNDIYGIRGSSRISNIEITDVDGSNNVYGIRDSDWCSNIRIFDIESTGGVCYGISDATGFTGMSNCFVKQLDATGNCYAFYNGAQLTNCYAEDIDSSGGNYHGFYDCENLSSCYAIDCEDGFNTCDQIAACKAESNDNDGFHTINNVTGCKATGNGNDGFNDGRNMSGNRADTNTGNGFDSCRTMTANRSTGNTGANYNNSFADFGALNACADTAAGGYNG